MGSGRPDAATLHRAAVQLSIQGRYAAAMRSVKRGLSATPTDELRARLMGTQAVILQRTGDPAAAEAVCMGALRIGGQSPGTRAILTGQLGALEMYGGRLAQAAAHLSGAIDGLADDPLAAARVRMNRSLARLQLRQLAKAAEDLTAAVEVFQAHGQTVDAAQARHNLGYTALLGGDLVTALRMMGTARETLAQLSPVSAAIGDMDRAEVLRDAGLTDEAERVLAETAGVFGRNRMPQARAEAEFHLARSQLTHDPAAASRTAATAARRFRALGNHTWAARADGIRVRASLAGGVRDRRGRLLVPPRRVPAAGEREAVASALDDLGLHPDAVAVRLAARLHDARSGKAVGRSAHVGAAMPIDVRLLAREVQVAVAAAAGRDRVVRRLAGAGIDELTRWQASFGSLDLQSSVAVHAAPLLAEGLQSALRTGRAEVVFDWSEHARHLGQQVVPLRPPPDAAVAAELAELRMMRAETPHGEWLAGGRARQLHERLREHQWATTGTSGVASRTDLASLTAALDEDTAAVAFVFTGDEMAAVVTAAGSAELVRLPRWERANEMMAGLRADLEMDAFVPAGPLAGRVHASLNDRLDAISEALIDPVGAIAGGRRLVLTTPGVLGGVPWTMLPALRGTPVTITSSMTRWVTARQATRDASGVGLVAGPRVRRGAAEVAAASSFWPHALTLGDGEAGVDAVASLAGEVGVLHIAAHGHHVADNPMFSGVELADGMLFGYDVDRMPRVPDTVVLSACEAGRSSVRGGEEAIGMTRVWLHAGARCVIAAPVVVRDDAACEVLGAMHEGLASGLAPAVALADATVRTGQLTPFQCYGSGM